uniref:Uncharacterized protein n=1 Tax=Cacopsylla melanoneura TaxID=428564 RepID=A0A8D9B0W5_9HEMI
MIPSLLYIRRFPFLTKVFMLYILPSSCSGNNEIQMSGKDFCSRFVHALCFLSIDIGYLLYPLSPFFPLQCLAAWLCRTVLENRFEQIYNVYLFQILFVHILCTSMLIGDFEIF